jgi:hypothetical protein
MGRRSRIAGAISVAFFLVLVLVLVLVVVAVVVVVVVVVYAVIVLALRLRLASLVVVFTARLVSSFVFGDPAAAAAAVLTRTLTVFVVAVGVVVLRNRMHGRQIVVRGPWRRVGVGATPIMTTTRVMRGHDLLVLIVVVSAMTLDVALSMFVLQAVFSALLLLPLLDLSL